MTIEVFVYDSATNTLKLNIHEILLVKEFKALWDENRNKCKQDPTGINRLKAYSEFTYIHLSLAWKSPYFQYLEQDKHIACLEDSGLTENDLKDELFKNAFDKYLEIRNSDRILSLINVAYKKLYHTEVFLDNIDFNNDVDENGRPIYKPSDVFKDISSIAKIRNDLAALELEYTKGLSAQSKVRGDNIPGFGDI